ncbi:EF-hand domain-containing protein [Pseudomonas sp. H1_D05]
MAKKMTDAEQLEHLKKTFRDLDENSDGTLTFEEFANGAQGFEKTMRTWVWDEYNKDRNSKLTLEEYLAPKKRSPPNSFVTSRPPSLASQLPQSKATPPPRSSPLNRMSVSSAAACDLDPPAPSAG